MWVQNANKMTRILLLRHLLGETECQEENTEKLINWETIWITAVWRNIFKLVYFYLQRLFPFPPKKENKMKKVSLSKRQIHSSGECWLQILRWILTVSTLWEGSLMMVMVVVVLMMMVLVMVVFKMIVVMVTNELWLSWSSGRLVNIQFIWWPHFILFFVFPTFHFLDKTSYYLFVLFWRQVCIADGDW